MPLTNDSLFSLSLFLPRIHLGQHGHLSSSLHPAHAHMHGGWYASGMGALGASSGLQGGFGSSGLGGGVVPHSQSYHLMVSSYSFVSHISVRAFAVLLSCNIPYVCLLLKRAETIFMTDKTEDS